MAFKHQFLHLMILGQPDLELEGDADNTDGFDLNHLKKRAKYIHFSKNYVWSYWKKEYLRVPRTQFQQTEIKGRRCSDYTRKREKQSTLFSFYLGATVPLDKSR